MRHLLYLLTTHARLMFKRQAVFSLILSLCHSIAALFGQLIIWGVFVGIFTDPYDMHIDAVKREREREATL